MDEFACARCGAVLTAAVSQVALPAHTRQLSGHDLLPALVDAGTYAVDPEPSGPPWRRWTDVGAEEAEARGVFAPVFSLSFGARGAIILAPRDARGMALIPERCDGYCMGLDGRDGPNLACQQCGQAVATRVDDCSLWQAIRLVPDAVRRIPCDGPPHHPARWKTLIDDRQVVPPIEQLGAWSPRWEAAIGMALASLVAASAGNPVVAPDGLLTDTFSRAADVLIPSGASPKRLALAGPELPRLAYDADIVLVPQHPQTGFAWEPDEFIAAVPLDFDVWAYLAFHEGRSLVPATGGVPDDVLRDDPLPLRPQRLFAPDLAVFLHTLARLPAVRQPWLRAIFDRATRERFTLF